MKHLDTALPDLGRLFTDGDDFDQLPLELQEWKVERLRLEYELFNKKYQKNCGSKGGRPPKWSHDLLEKAHRWTQQLMQTPQYKNEAQSNDKGIHAYRMMVIEIFSDPEIDAMLDQRKKRNREIWQDEIHSVAQAIKVRVDAYLKKQNITPRCYFQRPYHLAIYQKETSISINEWAA